MNDELSEARWVSSIRNSDTPYGRVSYREVEILYSIRKNLLQSERVFPSHLADYMSVQRSVVTCILATLDSSGFIVRQADPDDAGAHWIEITEKGTEVSEYIERIFLDEMLRNLDFLTEDQIASFNEGIEVMWRIHLNLELLRKERGSRNLNDGIKTYDIEPL